MQSAGVVTLKSTAKHTFHTLIFSYFSFLYEMPMDLCRMQYHVTQLVHKETLHGTSFGVFTLLLRTIFTSQGRSHPLDQRPLNERLWNLHGLRLDQAWPSGGLCFLAKSR